MSSKRGQRQGPLNPALQKILERLPREPGVYLFKGHADQVLYVGKAKSLAPRVRSYFQASSTDNRAFVPLLAELVGDIEIIITANEKEALLLENNLIKRHRPRFNVMLRDDKSYLVLRLDPRAAYPRLEITRRIKDDGARYFGPYHSARDCRQTLRLVNRYFQLRTCSNRVLASRSRPCLQHQIGRCLAPCALAVDAGQYAQQVQDVTLFLRGRGAELQEELSRRMQQAAATLDFEQAARLRDQIAAVQSTLQGQQVVSQAVMDRDVFGYYREGDRLDLVVLIVRQGKLVGRRTFSLSSQELPDAEVLSALISQYYDRGEEIPRQVLVPLPLEDAEAKRLWLSELRGGAVEVLAPQRGSKRKLLELAQRNAHSSFQTRRQQDLDAEQSLGKLQHRLRLTRLPRRIECFDISSFQGELVVASLVVMEDALPRPRRYRRFKVRAGGTDDFAAMYEVISRRLRKARQGAVGWELPDLLLVDGGKAQLSMAQAALRDVGLPDGAPAPELAALAKERAQGTAGEPGPPDRVFLPGQKDPLRLRANTAELYLLARLRDEAHRFAIGYHRDLRRKRTLRSGLEQIPGIGPHRRQLLLRTLGSLKRVRQASLAELAAVPSMSLRAAEEVLRYFAGAPDPEPPAPCADEPTTQLTGDEQNAEERAGPSPAK